MSVRDYNATPSSNTTISSIDIAEGCSPSGINNAIRQQMADLKDVSTGAVALESPKFDSILDGNIKATDASGTDTAGTATTIKGGAGTGTGAGGSIIFQVADGAGSTGSSVNAHATAMTITDDGNVDIAGGLNVGTIKEATGTTTAMTIDSNGQVLLSAIPFMKMNLSANTSVSATTTGVTMPLDNVISSRGITLNTSTYKFQVPVTGLYHFSGAVRVDSGAIDYLWWSIADSSGTALQTNQLVLANYRAPVSNFSTVSGSAVQSLTASTDYQIIFGVSASAVGTQTVSGGQTWMDIYLLGAN